MFIPKCCLTNYSSGHKKIKTLLNFSLWTWLNEASLLQKAPGGFESVTSGDMKQVGAGPPSTPPPPLECWGGRPGSTGGSKRAEGPVALLCGAQRNLTVGLLRPPRGPRGWGGGCIPPSLYRSPGIGPTRPEASRRLANRPAGHCPLLTGSRTSGGDAKRVPVVLFWRKCSWFRRTAALDFIARPTNVPLKRFTLTHSCC